MAQGTGRVAVVSSCSCAARLAMLVPGGDKHSGKEPASLLRLSSALGLLKGLAESVWSHLEKIKEAFSCI